MSKKPFDELEDQLTGNEPLYDKNEAAAYLGYKSTESIMKAVYTYKTLHPENKGEHRPLQFTKTELDRFAASRKRGGGFNPNLIPGIERITPAVFMEAEYKERVQRKEVAVTHKGKGVKKVKRDPTAARHFIVTYSDNSTASVGNVTRFEVKIVNNA